MVSPARTHAPSDGTVTSTNGSPWLMLALATVGFAVNFWAWALISPLGPMFRDSGALGRTDRVRRGAAGGGARAGRVAGPDPGRRAHRSLRRPRHVPDHLGRHHPAGAVHRVLRSRLLRPAARGWLLPRHRRHRLRRRCAVRQRLVPARAPRARDRHLRCRHGRDRDQRADHGQAVQPGREASVPDHGGRAGGLRRRRLGLPAGRPGSGGADDQPGQPTQRQRAAADHLAGLHPLRRRLRRLRRVLGLPAGLPQDRSWTHPGRRRQPDGRLRGGRGDHAPDRRLALRPVRSDPRPGRGVRRRGRRGRDLGRHAAPERHRHRGVPGDGRGAGGRQRRDVRADRQGDRTRAGSVG